MRCKWPNLESSDIYIKYHDDEWGVISHDDRYLFEMLVLESFQSGISWLTVLKKRDAFKTAFDDFDVTKVKDYNEDKIKALYDNEGIIRNKAKINAAVNNANCFMKVQEEFGSFSEYIWSFSNHEVIYRKNDDIECKNELSDRLSKDLKKRGFKFIGSVTAYSYLEAIGVINNHFSYCFKYKK